MATTKLRREDVQKRFDDIGKLLEKELQWRPFPHPTCSGFEVTPQGVWEAADQLSSLKKDVLKYLDYLHKGNPKQIAFDFVDDNNEAA
jgi:hypothetical protein